MQTFVAAFDTLFGGFRQRAQKTFELLQADGTAFLVVAAPEPDALREAAYFVERLSEDDMPLAGLVVNRASPQPQGDALGGRGDGRGGSGCARTTRTSLTAGLLRLHADRVRMVEREARLREPLRGGAPAGADGRRAGPGGRRARPRRAASGRRAPGGVSGRPDAVGVPTVGVDVSAAQALTATPDVLLAARLEDDPP